MEINKQLFEDVLSGKFKGAFVLRNGFMCNSIQLGRNGSMLAAEVWPYCIQYRVYRPNGKIGLTDRSSYDIVDFIPDTNMKENELTIEIPEGKIVDWDESKKQNKIVFKDKQLTYEDICDRLPGMIDVPLFETPSKDGNALVANEHQLECILAKNKLANVAKYLNDGWKPTNMEDAVYYLTMDLDARIFVGSCSKLGGYYFSKIMFKSGGLAKQAIEILGEETVKLALEPLGI